MRTEATTAAPRLGDYFVQRQEAGRAGLPTLSVTLNDGLVLRSQLDRRTESALAPESHLLVRAGDLVYNTMRMWQGACGVADRDGLVSPAYVVMAPQPGINSRFAYHWFKTDRMLHLLWAYSHGITDDRLRLYADDFASIPVMPLALDQQRTWAAALDHCDEEISRTERLIEAKRRRKAALVNRTLFEASAEPGSIGDLATVNPRASRIDAAATVSFVAMEDVSEHGELVRSVDRARAELGSGYTQFNDGDVLVAKITPCFENGKGALAEGLTSGVGFGTTEFHVVRPKISDDADYLHQATLTSRFRSDGERHMTGSAGQRRVPADFISGFQIALHDAGTRKDAGRLFRMLNEDIAQEQARLDRLRLQKRGLMQKLLTVECRLGQTPELNLA